jgi:hypothetical protein
MPLQFRRVDNVTDTVKRVLYSKESYTGLSSDHSWAALG